MVQFMWPHGSTCLIQVTFPQDSFIVQWKKVHIYKYQTSVCAKKKNINIKLVLYNLKSWLFIDE